MNAITAPPKSVGRRRLELRVGDHVADRLLDPPRSARTVMSRPERMSAVIVPITRFASGAESVVYLSRIAGSAGSFATSCVTMTFVAVGRRRLLRLVVDREVDVRDHDGRTTTRS